MVFAILSLAACDNDKNKADDPQTNYLRLSDLTPLHLVSLSQAESKLKEMGFTNADEEYVYTSSKQNESIVCELNSDGFIESLSYIASKGIVPKDAKKWLSHISENVTLPKYIRTIPFAGAYFYNSVGEDPKMEEEPKFIAESYQQYISLLENLTSGMRVEVFWEEDNIPEDESVGYSVAMIYCYGDNVDQAILNIASLHRVEPPMAE